jgi:hypothetical protein
MEDIMNVSTQLRQGASAIRHLIQQLGFAVALGLLAAAPDGAASAQSLSPSTIVALQESLNKQGIAVPTDGVLSDATRAAIRQYQSQHHLPVTGEPDRATLAKLGVADREAASPAAATAQAAPQSSEAGQTQGRTAPTPQMPMQQMPSGMMSPSMMHGMTQMMHGMMRMMQSQMRPASGRAADRDMMGCPMMHGSSQGPEAEQMRGMMQMMQGMMTMMHGHMRSSDGMPPARQTPQTGAAPHP